MRASQASCGRLAWIFLRETRLFHLWRNICGTHTSVDNCQRSPNPAHSLSLVYKWATFLPLKWQIWRVNIISQNTYPWNERCFNDREVFCKSSWATLESLEHRRNVGEEFILCLPPSFLLPWSPVPPSWTSKPAPCWRASAPLSLGYRKQDASTALCLW